MHQIAELHVHNPLLGNATFLIITPQSSVMVKHILFVCIKNAARSQMAEGFFNYLNKDPDYAAISAGLEEAERIDPEAIKAMSERGIDISKQKPKLLTLEMISKSHRIVTMGCIDQCPAAPPEKTEEWELADVSGKPMGVFREVRDEIEKRVKELISRLK